MARLVDISGQRFGALSLPSGGDLRNVVKYIARAGRKGSKLADLKKARWYLDREIGRVEQEART